MSSIAEDTRAVEERRLDPTCARCSVCVHYREVWHPQPGVSWDRCAAFPKQSSYDWDLASCEANNRKNDCKKFQPGLLRRVAAFIGHPIALPEVKWWVPYL